MVGQALEDNLYKTLVTVMEDCKRYGEILKKISICSIKTNYRLDAETIRQICIICSINPRLVFFCCEYILMGTSGGLNESVQQKCP